MEKKDADFSKSVVEIKSRKSKIEFLLFASLSAEKGSANDFHAIEKAKIEQRKQNLRTAKFL